MYPFATRMLAGVSTAALVVATTTFNPADKAASVTLSNGNRTAQFTAAEVVAVRSTKYRPDGKYYFEFTYVTGASTGNGLANANFPLTGTYVGNDANSIDYNGGNVYFNAQTLSTGGKTQVQGDVLGVAVDLTARTVAWYINGALQATSSSMPSGALAPVASGNTAGHVVTLNCGQVASSYGPPAGYSWWG